jgi:hypothetical protein
MNDPETATPHAPVSPPARWDWNPKLRWFAAEILIVISGVLIALALNAWWSEQQDLQFERDLRDDMIAEFEANLAILESDLTMNDSAHVLMSSLNTLSDSALLALSSDDLTIRFRDLISWAGFDPEMGIVQAQVESGNLSAIGDRDLRLLLSRWAGLLEENRRKNVLAVTFGHNQVVPMTAKASADLVWTEAERRELQTLYRSYSSFQRQVIFAQQRLREAALEIRVYLEQQR